MSEFMGNICGVCACFALCLAFQVIFFKAIIYSSSDDAKEGGFLPGGASLHNMNSAHGPDTESFEKASNAKLTPVKIGQGSMSVFLMCYCL